MPGSDLPTLIPKEQVPTVIAQTAQALVSLASSPTPSSTHLATLRQSRFTLTPTIVDTPTISPTSMPTQTPESAETATITTPPQVTATLLPPFEIPFANIQFITPGALSKVISPIGLHAFLIPGDSGRARVELFGEDGHLMYRKLFVFSSPPGVQTNLRANIDFEIKGVAETARLVISVDDSYGRLKMLASENLILLSLGDPDINPPDDFLATVVIQEPASKVLIQGGTLVVSGLARISSDRPLLVELITTSGKVIGNRLAGVATEPQGGHRVFAATIPYTVSSPTWVRVTVSEWSYELGGPVQLTSEEVLLGP